MSQYKAHLHISKTNYYVFVHSWFKLTDGLMSATGQSYHCTKNKTYWKTEMNTLTKPSINLENRHWRSKNRE